ncbi:hypothetical protein PI125_g20556 [Phytophthora idaei]|nr:hypothetical protein PI125_g20556 [Phytophthora idaei]
MAPTSPGLWWPAAPSSAGMFTAFGEQYYGDCWSAAFSILGEHSTDHLSPVSITDVGSQYEDQRPVARAFGELCHTENDGLHGPSARRIPVTDNASNIMAFAEHHRGLRAVWRLASSRG